MILLIAALSFSLLGLEVALLRALAFLQWYHFAYLIISLAMLGFGAAGTAHHLLEPLFKRLGNKAVAGLFLATGITMAAVRPLMVLLPQDTFLAVFQPSQWIWLVLMVLLLFLPFFVGALTLLRLFTLQPERVGWLYGANLAGSGAGAIGALFLLDGRHPLELLDLLGLATALLALVPAWMAGWRYAGVGVATVVVVYMAGQWDPASLPMSQYKDLARTLLMPDTKVMAEGYDPRGVITVVHSPYLRPAGGLSLTYAGDIPVRPVIFFNGAGMDTLPRTDSHDASNYLRDSLFALPYPLRHPQSVLVPHAGAGGEVWLAQREGANRILALEPNRTLVRMAEKGLPGFPSVYGKPGVQLINQDARAYLEQSLEQFDLIALPTVAGQTAVSSAMRSIYEDYLMTVDSFAAMIERLSVNGILRCSVALDAPPRRPLRLFGILTEALRRHGVQNPNRHVMVVRSWNLTLFLLSKKPFTDEELTHASTWASDKGFDTVYPGGLGGTPQHQSAESDFEQNLARIAAREVVDSPFNLDPPTDNSPYFEHFLTWDAAKLLRERYGPAGLLLLEWGYVMVWITLIALFVGGVGMILLPLWIRHRGQVLPVGSRRMLLYFAGIGSGFMLVEMVLIQKLTLLLGDPVFAVGTVLAALLVFAGLGSMTSERWTVQPNRVAVMAGGALSVTVILFWLAFPWFHNLISPLELFPGRLSAVVVAMAPMAWMMGWFFPNGMRAMVLRGQETLIPWAWAINGLLSVLSGALGVLLALNNGLAAVMVAGLLCYGVAVVAMAKGFGGGTVRE